MIKIQENNGTLENIRDICVIENIRTRRHHFIARLYIPLLSITLPLISPSPSLSPYTSYASNT